MQTGRGELIQDQLRRLGGTPDALADAFGLLTVLTKSAAEQVQPLSEGVMGVLVLEHQMRDRLFIRLLAQARNESGVADLMRRLEAAHSETIQWIRLRLAEWLRVVRRSWRPPPRRRPLGPSRDWPRCRPARVRT